MVFKGRISRFEFFSWSGRSVAQGGPHGGWVEPLLKKKAIGSLAKKAMGNMSRWVSKTWGAGREGAIHDWRLGLGSRLHAIGIFQIGPYCALQPWPVVDTCDSLLSDRCETWMFPLIAA